MPRLILTTITIGAIVLLLVFAHREKSRFKRLEAAYALQGSSLSLTVAYLNKNNPDGARQACLKGLAETLQFCESEKLSGEATSFFLSGMQDSLSSLSLDNNQKENLKKYIEGLEQRY